MTLTKTHPHNQRGFVLVIVLAVLVVLTLLAAAVATSSERAIRAAQADVDRFNEDLAMMSTRETILFMLATQRQTLAGLTVNTSDAAPVASFGDDDGIGTQYLPVGNEIHLDNTRYKGIAGTSFSVQDDRGLLSINWDTGLLSNFFKLRNIPNTEWQGLSAKLLDYQDKDDLHRLDGAEKAQYLKEGLAPPTNRTLATPLELRRVLGWRNILANFSDTDLLNTFTLARSATLNINTAPLHVIALLPGITPQNATRMVELRRATPFQSDILAAEALGIPVELTESLSLFANGSGNLMLWGENSGARHLLHWTLTPLSADGRPWRIDYKVTLPRANEPDQTAAATTAAPLLSPSFSPGGNQ